MRFTLGTAVWLFLIGLTALMGGAFWYGSTRATARVAELAAASRATAVDQVAARVDGYLGQGDRALLDLGTQFGEGRCSGVAAAESCLVATLVANRDFSEVTYITEQDGSWQLSVFRAADGRVCTFHVAFAERKATTRCRLPYQLLSPAKPEGEPVALTDDDNPTDSYGFMTPFYQEPGHVIRSDLSRSKFDESLVRFLALYGIPQGVLKVGLFEPQLRKAIEGVYVNNDPKAPFQLFVCDTDGDLVTGLSPNDVMKEYDDDFHIDPATLPAQVVAAQKHETRQRVAEEGRTEGTFELDGKTYHVGFRALQNSQRWSVGVVGPDDYYLRDIREGLNLLRLAQMVLAALVLLGAVVMTRAMQRALQRIKAETDRMRRFDFTPATPSSPFFDVRDALWNLELAKTAMRALGRFVPVALVRRLFEANQEPSLSSEPRELTMMFTDIEGFTALVEREEPLALARWLGDYFAAMTRGVHAESGIVDKFIGDAVMALWNAPNELPDHAVRACAGALRCLDETEALYASPAWAGRPKLVTRFGLHVSTVLVGHFGAPDRVSYTAIGDGVNLASRLEGLNKLFGTRIIVSAAIEQRARHAFEFRKLDRVAVKGKSQGGDVFELLGPTGKTSLKPGVKAAYEAALTAYWQRDFAKACELLANQLDDDPSRVLHERCARFRDGGVPAEWDGTLHAEK
ncbi:MAG: adenylate/guanylate cyclase domain-containing protein [Myxococcaceae bacterium]|nr:adenylate/guanylate cyclase domain-containing protein [Myxococcaceae bacterium]